MPRRKYRVAPDLVDDMMGQFDLHDTDDEYYEEHDEEGWPEGMDRHAGTVDAKPRKRLLDNGNAGFTVITEDVAEERDYPLFEASCSDSLVPDEVTIHCTVVNTLDYAPDPNFRINVEWGIQNFISSARLDLINGMMFSLMATYLKVSVSSAPAVTTGIVRVGVSASYGIRPASSPPQKTEIPVEGGAITPGNDGGFVTVPAFAKGVYTMPAPAAAATQVDFVMRQLSQSGSILSLHPYVVGGIVSPLRVPLLNNCRFIDILNVDAADSLRVSYIFDLAF